CASACAHALDGRSFHDPLPPLECCLRCSLPHPASTRHIPLHSPVPAPDQSTPSQSRWRSWLTTLAAGLLHSALLLLAAPPPSSPAPSPSPPPRPPAGGLSASSPSFPSSGSPRAPKAALSAKPFSPASAPFPSGPSSSGGSFPSPTSATSR